MSSVNEIVEYVNIIGFDKKDIWFEFYGVRLDYVGVDGISYDKDITIHRVPYDSYSKIEMITKTGLPYYTRIKVSKLIENRKLIENQCKQEIDMTKFEKLSNTILEYLKDDNYNVLLEGQKVTHVGVLNGISQDICFGFGELLQSYSTDDLDSLKDDLKIEKISVIDINTLLE